MATGGLLAAVGIALLAAQPAGAEVNGGCKASMAGVNLAHTPPNGGPAVTVSKDAVVPFSMTGVSGEKFSELHIYYTIAGFDIDVYDASASGGTWSHNIDVHSFARFGVGYYRLKGVGDFAGGAGRGCDGEALINVTGDPLGTVAGDVAAGATVAGVLGMLGAGVGAGGGDGGGGGEPDPPVTQDDVAKESERRRDLDNLEHGASEATGGWCSLFGVLLLLLLPLVLLFGTGAVALAAVVPVVKVRRRRWPYLLGAFSGLLTGLGGGVLLQQYAIVYPTRTWAIVYVAGGILLGLAIPSLRRALAR